PLSSPQNPTTSDPLCESDDKTLQGWFCTRGRKKGSARQRLPILRRLRLRWHHLRLKRHQARLYLREVTTEFCNFYRRIRLLRDKRLLVRGVRLLSVQERHAASPDVQRKLLCARSGCIRRL